MQHADQTPLESETSRTHRRTATRIAALVLAALAMFIPLLCTFDGLSPAGHRMLAIFIAAIVLWVSEAIPLHATAALVILLNILLVSDKALLPAGDFKPPAYTLYFGALANPVLMLFLGGFFLAAGASKYRLDSRVARTLLKPFGSRPDRIILGLMLIIALFSMFMSNTAITAAFMTVVLPVIARLPADDRARTALALCVPFAANIGGMGTPVGTPPNAIALGALAKAGHQINFAEWVLMIAPPMLLLLLAAWQILVRLFPPRVETLTVEIQTSSTPGPQARIYYITAAATVLLWFTEPLHGIQSALVGFLPVVVLLATGVITEREFHAMPWSVLWLVAGGIALGDGIAATGLDRWLVAMVHWQGLEAGLIGGTLALLALFISTFISNSATANLLVPVGISLATSPALNVSPVLASIFIAIGCSLAMALPISTPPNAIAYATQQTTTRQMALAGGLVGITGLLIFVLLAPLYWRLCGLLPD